ncbi:MAG: hypothetical protein KA020_15730 [Planctomycetes bacterium]|nr:hypothetical protein [Planctomycetota bacterium]
MSAFRSCLLFALTALPIVAQDNHEPHEAPARPVVLTATFGGGTMAEFVAVLRAAEPRANVLVAAAAAQAKLPRIELRGAGLDQALEGACAVAEADFQVRSVQFPGQGEPVFSIVAGAAPKPAGGAGAGSGAANAAKPDLSTQVFSLNRLTDGDPRSGLAGLNVDTILSAIAASSGDEARPAELRFHRESGLLFVRGSRAQLSLVKDLLTNLERDQNERRMQAKEKLDASGGMAPAPKSPK